MIQLLKFRAFALPLLLLTPLVTRSASPQSDAFQIKIVDAQTGRGLSDVRVIADGRITCFTRNDGTVRWSEAVLMDRDVHFSIHHDGYQFPGGEATLHVTHGQTVQLALQPSPASPSK
jgi:hypothetical protein